MQSNSNGNHGLWVFNLSELKPSTVDDRSIEDDVLQMMKSSDVKCT